MRRTEQVTVHPAAKYNTSGDLIPGSGAQIVERCRVEPVSSSGVDAAYMHGRAWAFRLYFKGRAPRISDDDEVTVRGHRGLADVLTWPTAVGVGRVGGTVVLVSSRKG